MPNSIDGPASPLFTPLSFPGNLTLDDLPAVGVSETMASALDRAPSGACVCWGIPFQVEKVLLLDDRPVTITLKAVQAQWLVFMHTSDIFPENTLDGEAGFTLHGKGRLNEHAADYVVLYADGTEERAEVRRRYHVGMVRNRWGENGLHCVLHAKPHPLRLSNEQHDWNWALTQRRIRVFDREPWLNWIWAWENPHPEKVMVGIRFEPVNGKLLISAISAGTSSHLPYRWETRCKAIFTLPEGEVFDPVLDDAGQLKQIRLDLGQVISAAPRLLYPNGEWAATEVNSIPQVSEREVVVEYTAHPDACFHLSGGEIVPVVALNTALKPVASATQRVTLRTVVQGSSVPVAVKLHIHGQAGEYLAPVDRHRIPNLGYFEDYSVDYPHELIHFCTYIHGNTSLNLPLGPVYIEVTKGYEIRPLRKVIEITPDTQEVTIELEKVLDWREQGWVSADTHVHYLSPASAQLDGAGEGVNVVNLLATQWCELMTNVGDFDGKTTFGSREGGGDGEYLVRVGTENRQSVMGHISLLGYSGDIIAPMTTAGAAESALGDPIEVLLTEWARQCRKQGGIAIIPHFPDPRGEPAATLVGGDADAVEFFPKMGSFYGGVDPYSLLDWYRFLNCGYLAAAVGGTDKMSATMAVGTLRTYARIEPDQPFTYENWMEAIRRAYTFVTCGPLLDFSVDGKRPGSLIEMGAGGGTVDVAWNAASVTVPMTRVELVVNGEIRESKTVDPEADAGCWTVKLDRSSWLAVLVRGHYPDKPEIVAAHSSPVMVQVEGTELLAAADAMSILEQIEGVIAYLDTLAVRPDIDTYRRMRLVLTSAHRGLHNRMHAMGYYHDHTVVEDHAEHH